jgi:transcriptional regulator with XRE-family HTH domain
MATTADQLRQAIERSGLTRYRVAKLSGISEAVLSRFANGQTDLSLTNTDKLCAALGLRVVLESKGTKQKGRQAKRGNAQ